MLPASQQLTSSSVTSLSSPLSSYDINTTPEETRKKHSSQNLHGSSLSSSSTCTCSIPTTFSALIWLTRWILSETESFAKVMTHPDAFVGTGTTTSLSLDWHDEEHLVTAGNGFILLAACLVLSNKNHNKKTDYKYRHNMEEYENNDWNDNHTKTNNNNDDGIHTGRLLLSMLEKELQPHGGYPFMMRCLQAFLNFYYCSVGELSVAVVAPVKSIMTQLECILHELGDGIGEANRTL